MKTIRRILCPVDFSRFSENALRHAMALARWYGSEIVVLHVLGPPGAPLQDFPPYLAPVPLGKGEKERLSNHLLELARPASDAGIPAKTVVVEGNAVDEILRLAASLPADLIVAGTHGHGGFERLLLGSVTEKLLRKATCPVLTIPAPRGEEVPPEAPLFKSIICPVDFSDASAEALEYASDLARQAAAHLTVLHVVEGLPEQDAPELAHFNVPEYRRFLEGDATRTLHSFVPADTVKELHAELLVLSGKPYRQILRAAERRSAGIIVMGVHGRDPLDIALFGSTANQLSRRAPCPVLTVHARKEADASRAAPVSKEPVSA